jgi:outer membrane protein TolC
MAEALPTVRLNTDYGRIGNTLADALGTYSVNATVTVPLFQGGRVRGRLLQTDAQLRQQAAQVEDMRSRIEYDVRTATLDAESADQRVRVAKRAANLADEQLAQARDRFAAGVTGNLEVVQAQEAVATATDNYLTSLHAHNIAKVSLARAIGLSEERVNELLGGRK